MHFSARRVTVCTLLWHDSMIFRKPIYTLKNCFGPPSHVLCTCAFLIWILIDRKIIAWTYRSLHHLKELYFFYILWKNQPYRTKAAGVMAFQSFDGTRASEVLTMNRGKWGVLTTKSKFEENPKILKVYQVDMFRKINWKEHDATIFRLIQRKWKKLWA